MMKKEMKMITNIDIFYSHRPDTDTPLEETMETLVQAVHQGKAFSNGYSMVAERPEGSTPSLIMLRVKP